MWRLLFSATGAFGICLWMWGEWKIFRAKRCGRADDRPPFGVRLHFDRRYRDHRVALAYIRFHRLGPLVLAAWLI